ncbi:MAG TPA: DNA ligase D [Methylibium sp.]|uniref:DNA ligase D n=1 Tax=Methylibium sp. TaxID=2067992 RepID=UPI002DB82BD0|nr:DNA ligase D [Methylibium sp.]HEU4458047.1 DNA ligase D [Methylibium sp.]
MASSPKRKLGEYRRKRDFNRTPEPSGDGASGASSRRKPLRFVIQKHAASHLHFDFRLELDGVMKSWAVPKGPSLDPTVKRMAVPTEDHPLAYADFAGDIPEGHYGAGHVVVWDRGSWRPMGDAAAGFAKGHVDFELSGERLHGRWALLRIARKRDDEREAPWLLIKQRDEHARAEGEFDPVAAWQGGLPPKPAAAKRAATAPPPRKPAAAKRGANAAVLAKALAPMLATPRAGAPAREADWAFELKFDGYRLLLRIEDGEARCFTRNGLDWTAKLAPIAAAAAKSFPSGSWIDGELVALREDGTPDFDALQALLAMRGHRPAEAKGASSPSFVAFDAPFLRGEDLRDAPWHARRAALLAAFKPRGKAAGLLRVSEVFDVPAAALLQASTALGLEGVIGKRRDSIYAAGRRSDDWIKLKGIRRQEFVVVGSMPGKKGEDPGSLALAERAADGSLRYVGNVGSGFAAGQRAELNRRLARKPSPKPTARVEGEPARGVRWVEPELVAEVAFAARTSQGRLRHAVFHGLRQDKRAADVGVQGATAMPASKAPRTAPPKLRVTHAERRIDAASGATKGDAVAHYARVAPLMLEHLRGRPVALLRAPQGVGGELFFQKHLEGEPVGGITLLDPAFDPGHAPLVEIASAEGLLEAAQRNTIELHTWNGRKDRIDQPDRIVLDLDPGEGVPWSRMQEAAKLARAMVEELGLAAFLKTSGGKGLHVVVPIRRALGWDEVKAGAKLMSEHLARVFPDRFVAISGPKRRVGKIFVDYLRNGRGATTVAAWSLRARPGLGVSVPIDWSELAAIDSGAQWTLLELEPRLAIGNAPWDGMARAAKDLRPALRRLASIG